MMLSTGCTFSDHPEIPPGVSRELAEQRAQMLSQIRYELTLTIPDAVDQPIRGALIIHLHLRDASRPLVLDFKTSSRNLLALRVQGRSVEYTYANGHVVIPSEALQPGENVITTTFIASDVALNRNPDYLYSLFVPDRASTAFPCFDQPNLKARFRLTLDVPAEWRAVSNGETISCRIHGPRTTYQFAETSPISTYLFAFAAGRFDVETAERHGRLMHMYHRETDANTLRRNAETIFDLHGRALDWLEEYTGIPYPFGKFDVVLIPSFQFGGMEHPGTIFYRADRLLLDASATQTEKLGRASLIAHETSHMWFGDLVTMEWFDDVWMKEVFANFMAAKIVHPAFPDINHDLRFFLTHYPAAYSVDRTQGANPIRQPLENLSEAKSLYGAIIYNKAPIVMRQLERLIGEAPFRDGLREYLNTFRFGNASWPELIDILDRRTEEDLKSWSRVWVEEPGRPTITTELRLNDDGAIASLVLRQTDSRGRGLIWNQWLNVLLVYPRGARYFPIQLNSERVRVAGAVGLPAPEFIIPNGRSLGYGLIELDPVSRRFLLAHLPEERDALRRAIAWVTLWEEMLEGQVTPRTMIELALRLLPGESVELNVQRLLNDVVTAYWRFIPTTVRSELAPRLETLFWRLMERASTTSLKSTYFRAYRSIVLTEEGVQRLERVWRKALTIPGLPLSERDLMTIALELAVREVPHWSEILDVQLERIENPERKTQFAFVRPAVSADTATRDAFFESLKSAENRRHEPWVLEAVRYLHHPLRARQSITYIRPSLDLLEEIQRTGDIFFPKRWLDATLNGHSSQQAADIVYQFLDEHPDYPWRLKAKILQSADGLFRATTLLKRSVVGDE